MTKIIIDQYSIIFNLESNITICVESHFIFRKSTNTIVNWHYSEILYKNQIEAILEKRISDYKISAHGILKIEFEDDFILEIFDSNSNFESYSITNGTETVIV